MEFERLKTDLRKIRYTASRRYPVQGNRRFDSWYIASPCLWLGHLLEASIRSEESLGDPTTPCAI
jgi:hypothetical protein